MKRAVIVSLVLGASVPAHASEYGCKVLLCLANPASNGGPKGVGECVPPINQLYHDLSKGRPFPKCDQADGNDGSSYARQVNDPYDPCPAPLLPAQRGAYVVEGQKRSSGNKGGWFGGDGTFTLSDQPQLSESQVGNSYATGARACVGQSIGSYTAGGYDNSYTVDVFDKVLWQPPQNPRAIDVYIDNSWQQRVRW
ncbi:hypothetical protein AWB77_04263 [Caballeronia fortuita]|uniref:Lipoprotein n=1 Tax=Caballeronia fortuita TaxID=1777138 RepID=A0A158CLN4_9BURK|nr:hypothetical protein [Caballeronia fortuita]SAK83265.1 hypothetical protein AWB77_04263 [Caballeronia fortuita]